MNAANLSSSATAASTEQLVDLASLTDDQLADKFKAWRRDPVLWCVERLGIRCSLGDTFEEGDQMDVHQKRLLRMMPRAIVLRKPIYVPSANAMGKDWSISGRASLWFYEVWGPKCKVVMTGPTERQVMDIMWNELKVALAGRPSEDELGRLVQGKLDGGPEHFITAFTTKESEGQQGKFQGIHSQAIMVVVSEAQAVDDLLAQQIEGITMAEVLLVVYLFNPLTDTGFAAKGMDDTINNIVVRLDAYDSINVKTGKQLIPGLVNKAWVDDKERRWNADGTGKDPRYMARVRGLRPATGINAVISRALYKACRERRGHLSWWSGIYGSIGVDPALTGVDDMVIRVNISGEWADVLKIPYCEAPEAVSHIAIMQKKHFPDGGCVIVIETDGLGLPIYQFYRKTAPTNLKHSLNIIGFQAGCSDRKIIEPGYANLRVQAAFYAKKRMMEGHIAMPDDPELEEEATGELYFTNTHGLLQLEDKDDFRARLGRSPNDWDAVKLAIHGLRYATKITPIGPNDSRDRYYGGSSFTRGGSAMAA